MITEDLIVYIQSQLRKNISKDIIISRLQNAGWRDEDIGEAFFKINPPTPKRVEPSLVETKVIQTNDIQKPQVEDSYREPIGDNNGAKEEKPKQIIKENIVAKPVFVRSFSEANKTQPITLRKETILEVQNQELMPGLIPKIPIKSEIEEPKEITKSVPSESPVTRVPQQKVSLSDSPNSAILHSYPQALLYANKIKDNLPRDNKPKSKFIKWLIIFFIIGILVGGVAFASLNNYLRIPSFNLSIIKKDPKLLIESAPIVLSELSSYKTKTTLSLTAPSFADITTGLLSGEKNNSNDKDFISLSSFGGVNNTPTLRTFAYNTIVESSMFEDQIKANIKYAKPNGIITIENLSNLLGKNSPEVINLKIKEEEFNTLPALWDGPGKNVLSKINLEKFISIAVPSYIDEDISSMLKQLANQSSVLEKNQETIEGIDSYHYEIVADRESSKKFVKNFIKIFSRNLNPEEESLIEDRLGATKIDSFEIWVGKDDSKIHQYKLSISSPLSRLIGLEDKGISGNMVTFDIKTTYYDFNISNEIVFPENVQNFDDFVKKVRDMKIENKLSSFKPLADSFKNSVGNFGSKVSLNGSCVEPKSGSLFSPVGHKKSASTQIANISSFMKNIESEMLDKLSCYSTPSSWAMSYPLQGDTGKYFCIDNKNSLVLDNPISGPSCK